MSDEATDQRENIESMALALKMIREKDAEIARLKAAIGEALELCMLSFRNDDVIPDKISEILREALGEKS